MQLDNLSFIQYHLKKCSDSEDIYQILSHKYDLGSHEIQKILSLAIITCSSNFWKKIDYLKELIMLIINNYGEFDKILMDSVFSLINEDDYHLAIGPCHLIKACLNSMLLDINLLKSLLLSFVKNHPFFPNQIFVPSIILFRSLSDDTEFMSELLFYLGSSIEISKNKSINHIFLDFYWNIHKYKENECQSLIKKYYFDECENETYQAFINDTVMMSNEYSTKDIGYLLLPCLANFAPSPLFLAACMGSYNCFTNILENNADIGLKDIYNRTLIHYAIAGGDNRIIEITLSLGFKLNGTLETLAIFHQYDLFEYIITHDLFRFCVKQKEFQGCLINSIKANNAVTFQKCANLSNSTKLGDFETSLFAACTYGRLSFLNYLLCCKDCDANIVDKFGVSYMFFHLHFIKQLKMDTLKL